MAGSAFVTKNERQTLKSPRSAKINLQICNTTCEYMVIHRSGEVFFASFKIFSKHPLIKNKEGVTSETSPLLCYYNHLPKATQKHKVT